MMDMAHEALLSVVPNGENQKTGLRILFTTQLKYVKTKSKSTFAKNGLWLFIFLFA